MFGRRARFAEAALVDGAVGVVVAPQGGCCSPSPSRSGRPDGGYDVIADPARLRDLDLAVLAEAAENYGGRRRGRA